MVVDVDAASYGGEADFELAVSVGASVAVRALIDEMDLTVVCETHVAVQPPVFWSSTPSRAELGERSLAASAGQVQRLAPDVSVVVLFTGSQATVTEFQQARSYLSREVNDPRRPGTWRQRHVVARAWRHAGARHRGPVGPASSAVRRIGPVRIIDPSAGVFDGGPDGSR